MYKAELDNELLEACTGYNYDLDKIKELVLAGADTNQLNKFGDNIFDDVFLDTLYNVRDNIEELSETVEKIKEIIPIMINAGWDIKKFGIPTMNQFVFSTYDRFTFELYKFMLQYDLTDNPKDYESALECVGTEESYQRCCEENHDLENMFYSIYEIIEAKMEGRNYHSIELYYDAIGLTIDKVIYFDGENTTVTKSDFIEYNADIGFVCGNKLLILRKGVNILFMNDRFGDQPQIDISDIFNTCLGSHIEKISFEHKTVVDGTTHYGQPTIIIKLSNGKKMKFSHNFGELPDKQAQSRFWIE